MQLLRINRFRKGDLAFLLRKPCPGIDNSLLSGKIQHACACHKQQEKELFHGRILNRAPREPGARRLVYFTCTSMCMPNFSSRASILSRLRLSRYRASSAPHS